MAKRKTKERVTEIESQLPVVLEKAKLVKPSYTVGYSGTNGLGKGSTLLGNQYDTQREQHKVYRQLYHLNWTVGACIDLIASTGSKKWTLAPADPALRQDPHYELPLDEVAPIMQFLNAPAGLDSDETWSSLSMKIFMDMLIHGSCIMEKRLMNVDPDAMRQVVAKAFNPFAEIVPNINQEIEDVVGNVVTQNGIPVYLNVLPFVQMEVECDNLGRITAYKQWTSMGEFIEFDPSEILHIFHPRSSNRVYGDSPLKSLEVICTADALIDTRQKRKLQNDIVLDTVFSVPNATNEEEVKKFAEQMLTQYRQAGANGNFIVTTEEVKIADVSKSKDGDFMQQGQMYEWEICKRLGVPYSVLGDTSGTSSSKSAGSDDALRSFVENTVRPLTNHIESALNRKLLAQFQAVGLNYVINYVLEDGDDMADLVEMYNTQIFNGSLTVNECRAKLGMDPIEGGDIAYVNGKSPITLTNLAKQPDPAMVQQMHSDQMKAQQSNTNAQDKAIQKAQVALRELRKAF